MAEDLRTDEQNELFRRLVDTFPGMAYRCQHDADWTLEFVSSGSVNLLGYGFDELVTRRTVAVSDLIHPDDLARVSLEVEKSVSDQEAFGCIYRMRRADGEYIWISEVGRGVFDEDGTLVAIEGFLSDVTAEVEARETTRLDERRATLARMASGVAHDFNNILTGVLGAVEALGDVRPVPEDAQLWREELDAIRELSARATALTRQLVTFGQPREARSQPLDLTRAIGELEGSVRRVVGPAIEIALRLPDAPLHVRLDHVQLEQVILNLAANARDATPDGGRIELTLRREGDTARVAVTDTGVGIDPAHIDRVFEPYFTTKGLEHGTGLGLATIRSIIDQAGGRIGVRSTPTAGSTFEIWLPLLDGLATEGARGTEVILLAEDDEAVRTSMARGLRRLGYTVLEAADGEKALRLSARHKGDLDVLVTDRKMPHLDGIGLAERLRTQRPELPAILVTGDTASGPPGLFRCELSKPMTPAEIARHIRAVLDDDASPS